MSRMNCNGSVVDFFVTGVIFGLVVSSTDHSHCILGLWFYRIVATILFLYIISSKSNI